MREARQNPEMIFGWYLVAYLDVLGQREKLRQLRRLPQTEKERSETYMPEV
jgi:hypothetical protein